MCRRHLAPRWFKKLVAKKTEESQEVKRRQEDIQKDTCRCHGGWLFNWPAEAMKIDGSGDFKQLGILNGNPWGLVLLLLYTVYYCYLLLIDLRKFSRAIVSNIWLASSQFLTVSMCHICPEASGQAVRPCAWPCASCAWPCASCAWPCSWPCASPCAWPCASCAWPCSWPCASPCAWPCAWPCDRPACGAWPCPGAASCAWEAANA